MKPFNPRFNVRGAFCTSYDEAMFQAIGTRVAQPWHLPSPGGIPPRSPLGVVADPHFSRTVEAAEHAEEENRPGVADNPSPTRQRGGEMRSLALAARKELRVTASGRLRSHDNVFSTRHLCGLRGEKSALTGDETHSGLVLKYKGEEARYHLPGLPPATEDTMLTGRPRLSSHA